MWVGAGPEQGPKPAVPVSIEHSKVEPASVEWKVKVGAESLVAPVGRPSRSSVSGGDGVDGEARCPGRSVLAAASVARTRKV